MDDICKNCKYWQDYTRRVMAQLSVRIPTSMANGSVELRQCRYSPPPTIDARIPIYTDGEFTCSAFTAINEKG